jgi:5-methylcytosine-specific restriction endonuclease McrA
MFIRNKYFKWYYEIVKNASNRVIFGYVEKHHIVPKSLGGTNEKSNLVSLTAREHFVCHRLLTKMTIGESKYKMIHASWRLANTNKAIINSRTYETVKTERSMAMTGRKNPGVSKALTGRKVPQEVIDKRVKTVTGKKVPARSIALKGKNNWSSSALAGRKQPQNLVDKRANSLRGKPSGALGRKQSDEEKQMRSELMKGRPSPKKGTTWSPERRAAYEASKNKGNK